MTIDTSLRSLSIDAALAAPLTAFVDLFEKWNRSINLSAASTREEIVAHLTDSLHVVPHLRAASGAPIERILDAGSGGGFPVVIAAICLPHAGFTSLEPVHKKHAFLRTAARELGLSNLEARAERLEDHDVHDYDAAMSRATFDLVEWLTRGRQHVKPGGRVIGFEAVPRDDLPAGAERHGYSLHGKQRAIVLTHG